MSKNRKNRSMDERFKRGRDGDPSRFGSSTQFGKGGRGAGGGSGKGQPHKSKFFSFLAGIGSSESSEEWGEFKGEKERESQAKAREDGEFAGEFAGEFKDEKPTSSVNMRFGSKASRPGEDVDPDFVEKAEETRRELEGGSDFDQTGDGDFGHFREDEPKGASFNYVGSKKSPASRQDFQEVDDGDGFAEVDDGGADYPVGHEGHAVAGNDSWRQDGPTDGQAESNFNQHGSQINQDYSYPTNNSSDDAPWRDEETSDVLKRVSSVFEGMGSTTMAASSRDGFQGGEGSPRDALYEPGWNGEGGSSMDGGHGADSQQSQQFGGRYGSGSEAGDDDGSRRTGGYIDRGDALDDESIASASGTDFDKLLSPFKNFGTSMGQSTVNMGGAGFVPNSTSNTSFNSNSEGDAQYRKEKKILKVLGKASIKAENSSSTRPEDPANHAESALPDTSSYDDIPDAKIGKIESLDELRSRVVVKDYRPVKDIGKPVVRNDGAIDDPESGETSSKPLSNSESATNAPSTPQASAIGGVEVGDKAAGETGDLGSLLTSNKGFGEVGTAGGSQLTGAHTIGSHTQQGKKEPSLFGHPIQSDYIEARPAYLDPVDDAKAPSTSGEADASKNDWNGKDSNPPSKNELGGSGDPSQPTGDEANKIPRLDDVVAMDRRNIAAGEHIITRETVRKEASEAMRDGNGQHAEDKGDTSSYLGESTDGSNAMPKPPVLGPVLDESFFENRSEFSADERGRAESKARIAKAKEKTDEELAAETLSLFSSRLVCGSCDDYENKGASEKVNKEASDEAAGDLAANKVDSGNQESAAASSQVVGEAGTSSIGGGSKQGINSETISNSSSQNDSSESNATKSSDDRKDDDSPKVPTGNESFGEALGNALARAGVSDEDKDGKSSSAKNEDDDEFVVCDSSDPSDRKDGSGIFAPLEGKDSPQNVPGDEAGIKIGDSSNADSKAGDETHAHDKNASDKDSSGLIEKSASIIVMHDDVIDDKGEMQSSQAQGGEAEKTSSDTQGDEDSTLITMKSIMEEGPTSSVEEYKNGGSMFTHDNSGGAEDPSNGQSTASTPSNPSNGSDDDDEYEFAEDIEDPYGLTLTSPGPNKKPFRFGVDKPASRNPIFDNDATTGSNAGANGGKDGEANSTNAKPREEEMDDGHADGLLKAWMSGDDGHVHKDGGSYVEKMRDSSRHGPAKRYDSSIPKNTRLDNGASDGGHGQSQSPWEFGGHTSKADTPNLGEANFVFRKDGFHPESQDEKKVFGDRFESNIRKKDDSRETDRFERPYGQTGHEGDDLVDFTPMEEDSQETLWTSDERSSEDLGGESDENLVKEAYRSNLDKLNEQSDLKRIFADGEAGKNSSQGVDGGNQVGHGGHESTSRRDASQEINEGGAGGEVPGGENLTPEEMRRLIESNGIINMDKVKTDYAESKKKQPQAGGIGFNFSEFKKPEEVDNEPVPNEISLYGDEGGKGEGADASHAASMPNGGVESRNGVEPGSDMGLHDGEDEDGICLLPRKGTNGAETSLGDPKSAGSQGGAFQAPGNGAPSENNPNSKGSSEGEFARRRDLYLDKDGKDAKKDVGDARKVSASNLENALVSSNPNKDIGGLAVSTQASADGGSQNNGGNANANSNDPQSAFKPRFRFGFEKDPYPRHDMPSDEDPSSRPFSMGNLAMLNADGNDQASQSPKKGFRFGFDKNAVGAGRTMDEDGNDSGKGTLLTRDDVKLDGLGPKKDNKGIGGPDGYKDSKFGFLGTRRHYGPLDDISLQGENIDDGSTKIFPTGFNVTGGNVFFPGRSDMGGIELTNTENGIEGRSVTTAEWGDGSLGYSHVFADPPSAKDGGQGDSSSENKNGGNPVDVLSSAIEENSGLGSASTSTGKDSGEEKDGGFQSKDKDGSKDSWKDPMVYAGGATITQESIEDDFNRKKSKNGNIPGFNFQGGVGPSFPKDESGDIEIMSQKGLGGAESEGEGQSQGNASEANEKDSSQKQSGILGPSQRDGDPFGLEGRRRVDDEIGIIPNSGSKGGVLARDEAENRFYGSDPSSKVVKAAFPKDNGKTFDDGSPVLMNGAEEENSGGSVTGFTQGPATKVQDGQEADPSGGIDRPLNLDDVKKQLKDKNSDFKKMGFNGKPTDGSEKKERKGFEGYTPSKGAVYPGAVTEKTVGFGFEKNPRLRKGSGDGISADDELDENYEEDVLLVDDEDEILASDDTMIMKADDVRRSGFEDTQLFDEDGNPITFKHDEGKRRHHGADGDASWDDEGEEDSLGNRGMADPRGNRRDDDPVGRRSRDADDDGGYIAGGGRPAPSRKDGRDGNGGGESSGRFGFNSPSSGSDSTGGSNPMAASSFSSSNGGGGSGSLPPGANQAKGGFGFKNGFRFGGSQGETRDGGESSQGAANEEAKPQSQTKKFFNSFSKMIRGGDEEDSGDSEFKDGQNKQSSHGGGLFGDGDGSRNQNGGGQPVGGQPSRFRFGNGGGQNGAPPGSNQASNSGAGESRPIRNEMATGSDSLIFRDLDGSRGKVGLKYVNRWEVKKDLSSPFKGYKNPSTDGYATPEKYEKSDPQYLEKMGKLVIDALSSFNLEGRLVGYLEGPVVTRFEVELADGVKGSQVKNINSDIARIIGVKKVSVSDNIGKPKCVGIDVPRKNRKIISFKGVVASGEYRNTRANLPIIMGVDITGEHTMVYDLQKAPHLLVAGSTGSGKSVGVNVMIVSLLLKRTPDEMRLILVDPKMLEFQPYYDIPHLLTPVITNIELVPRMLAWCVEEMEKRYEIMSRLGVRGMEDYNNRISKLKGENKLVVNPYSKDKDDPDFLEKFPYIVIIIDELGDLMIQQSDKSVEEAITRLAQKARAAGIHLVLTTQRPSTDVITGGIKANINARVGYTVNSNIESRIIIDSPGLEELLGNGDMFLKSPGELALMRLHGAFIPSQDVDMICDEIRKRGKPVYLDALDPEAMADDGYSSDGYSGSGQSEDELYDKVKEYVITTRKTSISNIQREFGLGFSRAAKLSDILVKEGVLVESPNSSVRKLAPRYLDGGD